MEHALIAPPKRLTFSEQERNHLIQVKRRTGLKTWNVPCRWALCISLADETPPPPYVSKAASTLEMTWQTFGGDRASIYWLLLMQRAHSSGLTPWNEATVHRYLRQHLARGIGRLAGRRSLRSIANLIELVDDGER